MRTCKGDAVAAFRRARDSPSTDLAASAEGNLGVVLGDLGRPHEALGASQQLIDDYRDDPSLRELVVRALDNTRGQWRTTLNKTAGTPSGLPRPRRGCGPLCDPRSNTRRDRC